MKKDERMGEGNEVKIVLVDDHALFRLGLKTAIANFDREYRVIAEAESAEALYALMAEGLEPDLAILDLLLPDEDGDKIAAKLRETRPDIKILVLSAEVTPDRIVSVVDIGVDGFIAKTAVQRDLLQALDTITSGESYFGSSVAYILSRMVSTRAMASKAPDVQFTNRELDVIKLCSEGLSTKQISDMLKVSPRTVETHKANVFQKLGITNQVELVRYAIKHGLVVL